MKWKFPINIILYCKECRKHFDIVLVSEASENHLCPGCGKVYGFKLDALEKKADEATKSIFRQSLEG